MTINKLLLIVISFIFLVTAQQKVLLNSVEALTFYKGRYTTGRRVPPTMQLKRVGGDAKTSFEPETVQCENRGSDGISIQWKCEAEMSSNYRLGKVEVVCEGYDGPSDPYILVGSCSLEYSLETTERGKSKENRRNQRDHSYNHYQAYETSSGSGVLESIIFLILFIIFMMVVLKVCSYQATYATMYQPSYTYSQPGYPTHHTTYVHNNGGGFWSGLGLGYLWGNSYQPYYNTGYNRSYQPSYSSYSSTSSYNDDDSSTHTSTGYGGTRTR